MAERFVFLLVLSLGPCALVELRNVVFWSLLLVLKDDPCLTRFCYLLVTIDSLSHRHTKHMSPFAVISVVRPFRWRSQHSLFGLEKDKVTSFQVLLCCPTVMAHKWLGQNVSRRSPSIRTHGICCSTDITCIDILYRSNECEVL